MPLARRKRVEGVSRFGRNRSRRHRRQGAKTAKRREKRHRFRSQSVAIGRDSVAIGRDSVAIGRDWSRFGRNRSQSVAIRSRFAQLTPKTRRKDGKTSRKTALRSVVKNGAGDNFGARPADFGASIRSRLVAIRSRFAQLMHHDAEDKAQRRQNVAKNGIDLGAWRGVDALSMPCRHPADTLPTPCRHPADTRGKAQDTKKGGFPTFGKLASLSSRRALLAFC